MRFSIPIFAGLLLSVNVAQAQEFPVRVTDDRPAEVILDEKPTRIITLSTFATDMAAALGIKPLGITTYDGDRPVYLGEAANHGKDLGGLTTPNLEIMRQLDPDLTIGMLRYNGPYEKEISDFSKFLVFDSNTIQDSFDLVAKMGSALGYAKEAEDLNSSYRALFDEIEAKLPAARPTYLFIWYFQDSMYAYHDELVPAAMFSRIGGRNLMGASGQDPENAFAVIEPEQLLEMDPDVLLVFASTNRPIKHSPLFDRLSSVKNGRAWQVGQHYSQSSGPIARELVVREVAHLFYPDIFEYPNMANDAQRKTLQFAR